MDTVPQIDLHYTDWIDENDPTMHHTCFDIINLLINTNVSREVTTYCMSDLPMKSEIKNNPNFPKFTFVELFKNNITSEELYHWSAPMNVIELYQLYLNQMSISNDKSLETKLFYNCTFPRFGSICQYELLYYHENHSSFSDIIYDYYNTYEYKAENFTCYTHLQCTRGPYPICLDWSEICNGQVDCLNGNFDEEHCWQLEINQCSENEYRCKNGQCIPQSFLRDDEITPDCQDGSDERKLYGSDISTDMNKPAFFSEERTCKKIFLTSSCFESRLDLMFNIILSTRDDSVSEQCWSAFKCVLKTPLAPKPLCRKICEQFGCVTIINKECPDMFYISNISLAFGNVYIAHTKDDSVVFAFREIILPYICYDNSRYDDYFVGQRKRLFKHTTCVRPVRSLTHMLLFYSERFLHFLILDSLLAEMNTYNIITNYTSVVCDKSNMYRCNNSSKCISINRFVDNEFDCPEKDDEDVNQFPSAALSQLSKSHFKCENIGRYIHQSMVQDAHCDCPSKTHSFCEDEHVAVNYAKKNVLFQAICDGITHHIPIDIEGTNESDETGCEQWSCDNIYSRCNYIWNCPNGKDETGCYIDATLNCSSDYHLCVSPDTNQLFCLPIDKGNDGNIDCLGGTDEPSLCVKIHENVIYNGFYCEQKQRPLCHDPEALCNYFKECENGEDEQFCSKNQSYNLNTYGYCLRGSLSGRSNVENFLCDAINHKTAEPLRYFSLDQMIETSTESLNTILLSPTFPKKVYEKAKYYCHRGMSLRVWLDNDKNLTTTTCLCPPSYYGNQCQYQNQRVSLTIQFQALSDSWSTLFAIIILLIDDSQQRIIHSYERFDYLSVRDCKIKFNMYLLYSTRPKDETKNYSIHVDIYEKFSLNYRTSLLFPVIFQFLPIQRIALVAIIPQRTGNIQTCSESHCIHGKCIIYSNNPLISKFCQCDRGWSGKFCNISITCSCSLDSICIGILANNQSVCLCPINKFGFQCLLTDTICQINKTLTCQNGGQCIPADKYLASQKKFRCICPKGFIGDTCEIVANKIILSFDNNIVLSQSIFIHFIEVIKNDKPKRTTTFRTIPLAQNSLTIYWSKPFHLVFIELEKRMYYLTYIQKIYKQSITINTMIKSSNRCHYIDEIFNETFVEMHILRRIKYYHLPCQNYTLNISCFYDDIQICLCYDYRQQRLANCFEFNHNMTFDCLGQSACENGGKCFQDSQDCPERSRCVCPLCFYGTRCQFSSNRFGLSLDGIIGYHIQPHTSFKNQPNIVKVALVLTILFLTAGFVNGILSLITFNNEAVCAVGCGIYLLGSSAATLLLTVIFALKFFILLLAQMTIISNQSFLKIQCLSLDFLLRSFLYMDQWLNACVAIERTLVIIKATSFHKKKSRKFAKIVILSLAIFIIGTSIYDPIYRRLIDEENEDDKRLWCITLYPPKLQTIDSIMHTFHFSTPLIINLISAIIFIIRISQQQAYIQRNRSYEEILKQKIREQKQLLISPIVLIILAIPRVIIAFVSKCMKSTDDAWLFLIGYFISFIPPALTFAIFVLPSQFYKQQFYSTVVKFHTRIQQHYIRSV